MERHFYKIRIYWEINLPLALAFQLADDILVLAGSLIPLSSNMEEPQIPCANLKYFKICSDIYKNIVKF